MSAGVAASTAGRLYRALVRTRMAEEKIVEVYPEQEMRCPVHLHLGQEAIPAGIAASLLPTDRVFGSHRSHGPYLALGGDLRSFYGELYGKESGCCRGRGGSMHLIDRSVGFWGSSALVGGTIPIAVGAALASKRLEEGFVSACFFGDGAVDEGVFTESLSFAALHSLPVIFVCENNFYATNSHQSDRQPGGSIHERATQFGAQGVQVDGNDVDAMFEVSQEAVDRARSGAGPTLIEGLTYRWKGHVGIHEDGRAPEELARWKELCPIARFEKVLDDDGRLSRDDRAEIRDSLAREIDEAHTQAKEDPLPSVKDFLAGVTL